MLPLFRHFRKSIFGAGQVRKYILYAIGEIALVVIGILIALQINIWNEERKTHTFEDNLLLELRQSINYDYSSIETVLRGNNTSKSSCQTILAHFDQKLPFHDSLNYHFWKANHWWQLNLRMTAYENAKSYGLHFIKNDTLRMQLTAVYENDVKWWDDTDSRLALYHYNVVEPYILNLFESTALNSVMKPHDYQSLRNDEKYKTILRTHIGNREWFEMIVKDRFLRALKGLDLKLLHEMKNR